MAIAERTLRMHIPSGSAGRVKKEPSSYYNALLFLEPHVRGRRTTISNIPGGSGNASEEMSSEDEIEVETLDDDEEVLAYLKQLRKDDPAVTCKIKSNHHQSKGSPIVHKVTDRLTDKENCFGNRTNMKRKSDEASDTAGLVHEVALQFHRKAAQVKSRKEKPKKMRCKL